MEKLILKAKHLSNTTILFLFMAPAAVGLYMSYAFNPVNADNPILYVLLLISDFIGIFSIMGLWFTILFDVLVPKHHNSTNLLNNKSFMKSKPEVDIFITVAGEPPSIVLKTANAAKNIDYHHQVFILDDGNSAEIKKICEDLSIGYVSRDNNKYAKAGNVNNGLRIASKSEFFAILDADQVPKRNFISRLLPYMSDPKVAMVQSPQYFTNTHNFIAEGTSQAQEIFYKYVCPAKNLSNSAFCVGTNMIFRRSAIDKIGGIAQVSHSEDIWTSYKLHELGLKTIFVNEVLAEGMAPDTIESYFKQQLRWATGGLSMFFERNPLASIHLTLDQKLQYFLSNSYYFVSITILAYLLFPLIYLLFEIKPLNANSSAVWLIHYVPYVSMYYLLSWLLLGKIKISTISVSLASFYPYVLALMAVVRGSRNIWVATAAKKRKSDPIMKWLWPHVFLIVLTVLSLIMGWYNPIDFWATVFYSVLAAWNMYLLILFVNGERKHATLNNI